MWDVLGELSRAVREALADWPGTIRLLCVMAAAVAVVAAASATASGVSQTTSTAPRT